ncbi:MAG: adenylyl-sulfate kinase [Chitinophagales bacterium]|nr:adenylyl-sulfate kinase [Chitinophagales bacterium]MDW8419025.1 adenylyl-sulfate kinase [Chitinophagales bacterium]
MSQSPHIHPYADYLPRAEKEKLLGQRGKVLWFTGLSGSGKSTIARSLERLLHDLKRPSVVLDGDNVRTGINSNLGFSDADRAENIRRVAEVAKLFCQNGLLVLCCFVSPTRALRGLARQIIGEDDYIEIYVQTPLEECEARDVKGLYARARRGEITNFTGISAPFEEPENPHLIIQTLHCSADEAAREVLRFLQPRMELHT